MFTLIILLISLVLFFLLLALFALGMDKGLEERDEAIKFIINNKKNRHRHDEEASNETIKDEKQ